MYCYLLQPFITIRSGTTGANGAVAQAETGWLDLSGHRDVFAWLDVKEVSPASPGIIVAYETSPNRDDTNFVVMNEPPTITAPGLYVTPIFMATAPAPLAKWFRWLLVTQSSATPWDMTFRIWLACNAPGNAISVMMPTSSSPSPPAHLVEAAAAQTGMTTQQILRPKAAEGQPSIPLDRQTLSVTYPGSSRLLAQGRAPR